MGVLGVPAGNLLDAILVLSPVGQDSTEQLVSSSTTFACARVLAAQHYAGIAGTGLGDFTLDPAGTVASFYALLDGIAAIAGIDIPTLTLHTLTDDQVFAHTTLAYQMLAPGSSSIATAPGFPSLGPNTDNPLLVRPRLGAAALGKLVSADGIVPYLGNGVCFP